MSVCDVPVISTVCDTAGQAAASLVSAPFDWLAQAMGAAAKWLFEAVWSVLDSTTLVDLTDSGYVHVYNILFGVACFLFLIFFCLQLVTGLVHRDPAALAHAGLGLAKSVLGSFLILTLTGLLLQVTDQLSVGIVQATGTTMAAMGGRIALLAAGLTTINIAAPGVGAIVTIFLASLAISAAATVWFSLLIRKALLLVAVVFGPVALAGATWQTTRGWFTKWASFVIALICSKLVLVVIFLVAITQTAAPIDTDLASISDPIAGVVLMFIAAFAPYITYKFISFAGFDMYHAMSSEQEAKAALNRPVPIPSAPQADTVRKVLDGGSSGGAGSGGGVSTAGVGPTTDGGPGAGSAAGTPPSSGTSGAGSGAATIGSGGAASAGAGAGSGAAGAAGGGAAAGPVGVAVVAGASVVKGAATAGPTVGRAVGGAAEGQDGAATEQASPPPVPAAETTLPPRATPEPVPPTSPAPTAEPSPTPSRRAEPPPPATPVTSGKE